MRQTAIEFKSNGLSLEGIITFPEVVSGPLPALLVCHPHPMFGGNMENSIVTALSRYAADQGMASLRFNYRGVGQSEGRFDGGRGEQDDVNAALNVLVHWPGIDVNRLVLAGYSFGASVILRGLRHYKDVRALILISPPISSVENPKILRDKRPKLFLVGQCDGLVSSVRLQGALDRSVSPVEFNEIPGADHGLYGYEATVAGHAVEFAIRTLPREDRRL